MPERRISENARMHGTKVAAQRFPTVAAAVVVAAAAEMEGTTDDRIRHHD
jgi:hypothetical protein